MDNIIEPSAPILVESLRAFGYSLETAIADLIDNSIAANADNIWIDFHWNGSNSSISITDDGYGIADTEINRVMTFGSQSPGEERSIDDLGRFGLGLKTASLSQVKSFTVCSKINSGEITCRQWDIDHIKQTKNWSILSPLPDMESPYYSRLEQLRHGTTVLWEKMDKIVSSTWLVNNTKDEYRFIDLKLKVKEHIAMVFHRFLEGSNPRLKLYIDGSKVEPWDPFCEFYTATERTPDEIIPFGNDAVYIKGFILPHKDKLTEDEYNRCKGPKGWNGQQGFYIYRNKRLLVSGSWLGLGDSNRPWTKEEQYKLARIRIDIPNTLDADWNIDVKKSTAKPPLILRDRLISLAQDVRARAREVFAHRGQYKKRTNAVEYESIWQSNVLNGKRNYFLGRKHPLIRLIQESGTNIPAFEALLKIIEQTVPVERIWLETAEQPENHAKSFENVGDEAVHEIAQEYLEALMKTEGLNKKEAIAKILDTDGFRFYHDVISKL